LTDFFDVGLGLCVNICFKLVQPGFILGLVFDLSSFQICDHIFEDSVDCIGSFGNVSLRLRSFVVVRCLLEQLPSLSFLQEPLLSNVRVVPIADKGIRERILDLLSERLVVVVNFVIRHIVAFLIQISTNHSALGSQFCQLIGLMHWNLQFFKTELDTIGMCAVFGQELLDLGEARDKALAIDESVLRNEPDSFLVCLHAYFSILCAQLLGFS